ncbi:MAG: hypothetical protein H6739_40430 [Alphaproteobacteria bacterium]|nr:hypothetical protein [Alphaproteobacteria bacterium]
MNGTLRAYQAKLDEIRRYIDVSVQIDRLLSPDSTHLPSESGSSTDILSSSSSIQKRFVYAASIVHLYSSFEAYVEEIVMAYLTCLDKICPTFSDLPQAIQDGHIDVSANLLLSRQFEKYRDRCDVEEVVMRLSQSNRPVGTRRVNELAYIEHKSNFRADSLNDFFRRAGIPKLVHKLKKHSDFRTHLLDEESLVNIEQLENSIVLQRLNDLAQRRNEIAHGVPTEILSAPSIRSLTDFMGKLGQAIHDVVESEFMQYVHKHGCSPLPQPIAVYRHRILCLSLHNQTVEEGSLILAMTPAGELRFGRVQIIEVDHKRVGTATAPPIVDVGLELNFNIKDSYQFFLAH